jgi:hypothetical protein
LKINKELLDSDSEKFSDQDKGSSKVTGCCWHYFPVVSINDLQEEVDDGLEKKSQKTMVLFSAICFSPFFFSLGFPWPLRTCVLDTLSLSLSVRMYIPLNSVAVLG